VSMHPFAESDLACAQQEIEKCIEALSAIGVARGFREQGVAIGEALRWAGQVKGRLREIAELNEMHRAEEQKAEAAE
jgi:hypothetical protein